jgi:UDP-2,4-diacetamido-2,4,6-trideoxy-beta-L-altropyranose hydrolase
MRAVFRVDAATTIGTGHVMRCLTLAKKLRAQAVDCIFITRLHPGNLSGLIREAGFSVVSLKPLPLPPQKDDHYSWLGAQEEDSAQTNAILKDLGQVDVLIVDHYGVDETWEKVLRPNVKRLITIDDLADRPHQADLLIDHNIGRQAEDYAELAPKNCKVLAGSNYALLRDEFASFRDISLERKQNQRAPSSILITLGGADADNFSATALEAVALLVDCFPTLKAHVVLSSIAPHINTVQAKVAAMGHSAELHINTNRMGDLMAEADICIGAAGVTMLERFCLGLPTLVLANAKNQIPVLDYINSNALGRFVGWTNKVTSQQLSTHLEELIVDGTTYRKIVEKSAQMCDGLGAERCLHAILEL